MKFSKKFPIVFWKIFDVKNCLNIYLSNKKTKLVVPLQLSELRAFK